MLGCFFFLALSSYREQTLFLLYNNKVRILIDKFDKWMIEFLVVLEILLFKLWELSSKMTTFAV